MEKDKVLVNEAKKEEMLKELLDVIRIYQSAIKYLTPEQRQKKFKGSFQMIRGEVFSKFMLFCADEMIRLTPDKEAYLSRLQDIFNARIIRLSKACTYLTGDLLKRELFSLKGEIVSEENHYCSIFQTPEPKVVGAEERRDKKTEKETLEQTVAV